MNLYRVRTDLIIFLYKAAKQKKVIQTHYVPSRSLLNIYKC